ncbi:NAD(P)-binding domain-containing protein [Nonomuraea longicatena]|uniref:L-lysine N6-monooxygenase MbtG n=1 Tax=Nonomuraea longicatena TaxID=83682 RepID=A0ABN1P8Z9_9ACTN
MLDVAIVGAGPYGLSAAAHATASGLAVQVFGRPMEAWHRHMPMGMKLKSEPDASHLADPERTWTLRAYCDLLGLPYGYAQPVPVERFVDYGRWFQERALPDRVVPFDVREVRAAAHGFTLTPATGDLVEARTVVLALGFLPFAYRPRELAALPPEVSSHSCEVNNLSVFAGQDVTLVGAGQSAIETACLLKEAGARPRVIARTDTLRWNADPVADRSALARLLAPESGLGLGWRSRLYAERPGLVRHLPAATRRHIVATTLGPAGSWWLRERFADVPVHLGMRVTGAKAGDDVRLELAGPSGEQVIHTDHVICATGYTVDAERFEVLEPGLRRRVGRPASAPRLSAHFETTVPGLFAIGLAAAPTFGPAMRFVHGARFAAETVTRGLVRRSRH